MKSVEILPKNYKQILKIDLQQDKKLAVLVNLAALAIAVVMVAAAAFVIPLSTILDHQPLVLIEICLVFLAGSIVYILGHEAVHGIFMKKFCTAKVNYGFTGLYAYAGSCGYYCKRDYIIIALAPVVVWGIILLILNLLLPVSWFYPIYLIQVTNLSGAAGDFYVTWKMSRLPQDILVQDTGVSMTVFEKTTEEN